MPARMAPEILTKKAWNKDRLMSMGQWLALLKRVTDQVEEFGWQLCHKAAADLDLSVDQVSHPLLCNEVLWLAFWQRYHF